MEVFLILLTTCLLPITVHSSQRYPPCDPPCGTGGHVPTCCFNHGFLAGGDCHNGFAFCVSGTRPQPAAPISPPPANEWSRELNKLHATIREMWQTVTDDRRASTALSGEVAKLARKHKKDKKALEKELAGVKKELVVHNPVSESDLQKSMDGMQAQLAKEIAQLLLGLQGNLRALNDLVFQVTTKSDSMAEQLSDLRQHVKNLAKKEDVEGSESNKIADLKNTVLDLRNVLIANQNHANELQKRIDHLEGRQRLHENSMSQTVKEASSELQHGIEGARRSLEEQLRSSQTHTTGLIQQMNSDLKNHAVSFEAKITHMATRSGLLETKVSGLESSVKKMNFHAEEGVRRGNQDEIVERLLQDQASYKERITNLEQQLGTITRLMKSLRISMERE